MVYLFVPEIQSINFIVSQTMKKMEKSLLVLQIGKFKKSGSHLANMPKMD